MFASIYYANEKKNNFAGIIYFRKISKIRDVSQNINFFRGKFIFANESKRFYLSI